MDHFTQRNDSNFYSQSQSDLMHDMNGLSIHNRSSINVPPSGYSASPISSSAPSSRASRLPPRPKAATEEWKKSSSSDNNNGWKTASSSNKKMESWKMSGKPRHAQLANIQQQNEDDPRLRRQSAPIFNSPSWHNPKPLPIEPAIQHNHEPFNIVYSNSTIDNTHYTTIATTNAPLQAPFHITTPMQPHTLVPPQQHDYYPQVHNNNSPPYPPAAEYPPINEYIQPAIVSHPPPQQQQQDFTQPYPPVTTQGYTQPMSYHHQEYPHQQSFHDYPPQQQPPYSEYLPTSTMGVYQHASPPSQAISLQDPPVPPEKTTAKKKEPSAKPEKKVRQITVQSINAEHRVWIDVLPAETGLSLAEKIHIIATFRTRKIVSIETASGRKVPLDNRPVFGSWMDMESFQDGERWTVEWKENDRGVVDRFMSKIVQAGGGKRKDHVAKEKE